MELEAGAASKTSQGEEEVEGNGRSSENGDHSETRSSEKKKKKKKYSLMPRFGCLTVESHEKGTVDMKVDFSGERSDPAHLVIMINGIIGSSHNWRYAAKQFLKKYPNDVIVHCSECNYSTLTFDGVDVMGDRLAEEVVSVIKLHPNISKISFIAHSLGGLVARYAIGRLYGQDPPKQLSHQNGDCASHDSGDTCTGEKFKGKIAGLEPMSFITSATPHLGSRGHKQVPIFCGFYSLEKVAARASWCLGRTGKHLFLTDSDDRKPPLLLQMVSDREDLKFISALQCFKRRVVYANSRFDHLVGWSTSSIRRKSELPKLQNLSRADKYPHVVNVETEEVTSPLQEVPLGTEVNGLKNVDIEEEMIQGLTKVGWERVDVSFSGSMQRLLAHNTIQVKTHCINSDGADVVQHMVDNFLL